MVQPKPSLASNLLRWIRIHRHKLYLPPHALWVRRRGRDPSPELTEATAPDALVTKTQQRMGQNVADTKGKQGGTYLLAIEQ
jgi:hypothetical protein